MIGPPPICLDCEYYNGLGAKCDAFPVKIPDSIWVGGDKHTKPHPDQKDKSILYKKKQ